MALSAYALRTVAAQKTLWTLAGNGQDPLIEQCINDASAMVERAWGRDIVSRGALTEFYPKDTGSAVFVSPAAILMTDPMLRFSGQGSGGLAAANLYLNEWPIVSVTSVNEDSARVYGSGSLLVADTDYVIQKQSGKLVRVSGATPKPWLWSWRAIKVVYIAGYQNMSGTIVGADPVPFEILRVFDELVTWIYRQRGGFGGSREAGLVSMTDAMGNRTFTGPAYITSAMQGALDAAGALRPSLAQRCGERA